MVKLTYLLYVVKRSKPDFHNVFQLLYILSEERLFFSFLAISGQHCFSAFNLQKVDYAVS